jgi:hypothetical protein
MSQRSWVAGNRAAIVANGVSSNSGTQAIADKYIGSRKVRRFLDLERIAA